MPNSLLVHGSAGMMILTVCVCACVVCMCVCVHVHSACVRTCICTCVHVHVCVRCVEGGVYTVWRVIFGGRNFRIPTLGRTLQHRLATPLDSANRACAVGGTMARGINRERLSCI